jgi:hypothetical protein
VVGYFWKLDHCVEGLPIQSAILNTFVPVLCDAAVKCPLKVSMIRASGTFVFPSYLFNVFFIFYNFLLCEALE